MATRKAKGRTREMQMQAYEIVTLVVVLGYVGLNLWLIYHHHQSLCRLRKAEKVLEMMSVDLQGQADLLQQEALAHQRAYAARQQHGTGLTHSEARVAAQRACSRRLPHPGTTEDDE